MLLGEANVERDEIADYFGVGGLHMLFNFTVNQQLWLAFAREDARPLVAALEATAGIPESDQWANFLRNHDEIDLGRLDDDARRDAFRAFGPKPEMQLYDRGIRRRLAPMLGGDRRRIELAFSILLTLPGTPVVYYGDEIGMGDDLSLPERDPVRTPMQWSQDANAGFSSAPRGELCAPVISRGAFGYRHVNAADQRRDPSSLLNWFRRAVRVRKEAPELGNGSWEALATGHASVLALRFEGRGPADHRPAQPLGRAGARPDRRPRARRRLCRQRVRDARPDGRARRARLSLASPPRSDVTIGAKIDVCWTIPQTGVPATLPRVDTTARGQGLSRTPASRMRGSEFPSDL